MSSEFWSTVSVLGLAGLSLVSKHVRFFVLHFFKGVKKPTKPRKRQKP